MPRFVPLRTDSHAGARAVPLEGTPNTRELGTLPIDGGTIRSGCLFRSAALTTLTDNDVHTLTDRGVRTVIDLRTDAEILRDGEDVYRAPQRLRLPMWVEHLPTSWPSTYHHLLFDNPRSVHGFFATLTDPKAYPVLFHCHSGKDRTGILSALLLEALGTPRDVIVDDYLQSQRNDPDLKVDEAWLQRIFDDVDAAGGIRPLLARFGVTEDDLGRIAANVKIPTPAGWPGATPRRLETF
jgi:protein-tyrosine phosphatase